MDFRLNNTEILLSLKKKEAEVSDLLKIKKRYEYEIETLREKFIDRDYRAKRIEEDNVKLKQKIKEMNLAFGNKTGSDVYTEILNQKEEIKRLKELIKSNEKGYQQQLETETAKFNQLLADSEEKYSLLLVHKNEVKVESLQNNELKDTIFSLQSQKNLLESRISALEEESLLLKQENNCLVEKNLLLEKKTTLPSIEKVHSEVNNLYKQANEVFLSIKGLTSKRDISCLFNFPKLEPEQDLFKTISVTKTLLQDTKNLLIEFTTENCGEEMCNPQ